MPRRQHPRTIGHPFPVLFGRRKCLRTLDPENTPVGHNPELPVGSSSTTSTISGTFSPNLHTTTNATDPDFLTNVQNCAVHAPTSPSFPSSSANQTNSSSTISGSSSLIHSDDPHNLNSISNALALFTDSNSSSSSQSSPGSLSQNAHYGNCVTCDSRVKWPSSVQVFRCMACLTINDLKPQRRVVERLGRCHTTLNSNALHPSQHRAIPQISVDRTRKIIEKCIEYHIRHRLAHIIHPCAHQQLQSTALVFQPSSFSLKNYNDCTKSCSRSISNPGFPQHSSSPTFPSTSSKTHFINSTLPKIQESTDVSDYSVCAGACSSPLVVTSSYKPLNVSAPISCLKLKSKKNTYSSFRLGPYPSPELASSLNRPQNSFSHHLRFPSDEQSDTIQPSLLKSAPAQSTNFPQYHVSSPVSTATCSQSRGYRSNVHSQPALSSNSCCINLNSAPPIGSPVRDPQNGEFYAQYRSTGIFRPLERYLINIYGNWKSLNCSFCTARPPTRPRTHREGSAHHLYSKYEATCTSHSSTQDQFPAPLDEKTLLLGNVAENGSWWSASHDRHSRDKRFPLLEHDRQSPRNNWLAISKSPQMNWKNLAVWYDSVLNAGKNWRTIAARVVPDIEHIRSSTIKNGSTENSHKIDALFDEIDQEMEIARIHVHRVLLKTAEDLLKRPGRVLTEPSHLRFLPILLANPLLYPSLARRYASKRFVRTSDLRVPFENNDERSSTTMISTNSPTNPLSSQSICDSDAKIISGSAAPFPVITSSVTSISSQPPLRSHAPQTPLCSCPMSSASSSSSSSSQTSATSSLSPPSSISSPSSSSSSSTFPQPLPSLSPIDRRDAKPSINQSLNFQKKTSSSRVLQGVSPSSGHDPACWGIDLAKNESTVPTRSIRSVAASGGAGTEGSEISEGTAGVVAGSEVAWTLDSVSATGVVEAFRVGSGSQVGYEAAINENGVECTASNDGLTHRFAIAKRIFGLMSNLSPECHRVLVSWLTRYPEPMFRRLIDLVASFVTHRLTQQESRNRAASQNLIHGNIEDLTGGMIPQLGTSSNSAELHAALGSLGVAHSTNTSGSQSNPRTVKKKKSEDLGGPKRPPYADDWQLRSAAKVMALLFAANNVYLNRRDRDQNQSCSSQVLEAKKNPEFAAAAVAAGLLSEQGMEATHPSSPLRGHTWLTGGSQINSTNFLWTKGASGNFGKLRGQLLSTSEFYNTLLDYSGSLILDFESWETRLNGPRSFAFCQYPFFLSIGAKIRILEYDARRQMENKAREAFFDSLLNNRMAEQYFHMRVRRNCLVEDSLARISESVGTGGAAMNDVKKGLRVQFIGEDGVDAGGPKKEWFLLLVRELFDPNNGMFVYDEESNYCYFNPFSFEQGEQFYLVGAVLGLAIYNSTILDVAIPPFVFRKLLASATVPSPIGLAGGSINGFGGERTSVQKGYKQTHNHAYNGAHHLQAPYAPSLDDLAELHPRLAQSLQQLLDFKPEKEFQHKFHSRKGRRTRGEDDQPALKKKGGGRSCHERFNSDMGTQDQSRMLTARNRTGLESVEQKQGQQAFNRERGNTEAMQDPGVNCNADCNLYGKGGHQVEPKNDYDCVSAKQPYIEPDFGQEFRSNTDVGLQVNTREEAQLENKKKLQQHEQKEEEKHEDLEKEEEDPVSATFCLTFSITQNKYGVPHSVDLCEGGSEREVTVKNRAEFVNLYVRHLLVDSVSRQFEPFKRGFWSVGSSNAIGLFRPEEVELLVRGGEEGLDVDALQAVAIHERYKDPTTGKSLSSHQVVDRVPSVRWFWEVLRSVNEQERRQIIGWITGSDRVPAVGASSLVLRIMNGGEVGKIDGKGREVVSFPVARTCFNMVQLPAYRTRAELHQRLWLAVTESEGFGLK